MIALMLRMSQRLDANPPTKKGRIYFPRNIDIINSHNTTYNERQPE